VIVRDRWRCSRRGIRRRRPVTTRLIEHNLGVMVVSHSDTAIIDRLVAPSADYGV
jgi:hypothetical protein